MTFMVLGKFKKPTSRLQIEISYFLAMLFFSVSTMFIIFHLHFWLLLEQQNGRGHKAYKTSMKS